jgi:hypothetical protein
MLADMGIDLASQTNVHVDADPRELKSPRAFCAPVHVPDEIYLVVMPKGGQDDYSALLHEGGHTEHFAHTQRDLPFEYRCLGDNAVTEGFAFIFDHLLLNREWLATYLDYNDADDFLRFANVVELFFLRRYAGKLAYECDLHAQNGSLDHMASVYKKRLSEAIMVEVPEQNYLVDVDEGFYAASYLRAWMFEGAFRMLLQDRHGMDWFSSPQAGDWVKELWSHGQQFTADQLLLKNGGGRLDTYPLKHNMVRAPARSARSPGWARGRVEPAATHSRRARDDALAEQAEPPPRRRFVAMWHGRARPQGAHDVGRVRDIGSHLGKARHQARCLVSVAATGHGYTKLAGNCLGLVHVFLI